MPEAPKIEELTAAELIRLHSRIDLEIASLRTEQGRIMAELLSRGREKAQEQSMGMGA